MTKTFVDVADEVDGDVDGDVDDDDDDKDVDENQLEQQGHLGQYSILYIPNTLMTDDTYVIENER